MPQTNFTLEYIISVVVALLSAYGVAKATPDLSPVLTYVIIPLAVAYIMLQLLNATLPGLNAWGSRVSAYVENRTLGEINQMGYVQIFPPLLAVTILVFVLLFTKNLS
jgi:mannose/fructose/N-acetylgalactosamine-specific phosphotransferase system component IIC